MLDQIRLAQHKLIAKKLGKIPKRFSLWRTAICTGISDTAWRPQPIFGASGALSLNKIPLIALSRLSLPKREKRSNSGRLHLSQVSSAQRKSPGPSNARKSELERL
jgi:hypothetical protein